MFPKSHRLDTIYIHTAHAGKLAPKSRLLHVVWSRKTHHRWYGRPFYSHLLPIHGLAHTHTTSSLLRWWSVQHWVRNLQWTCTEWIADSLKRWSPTSCLTKALQVFLALSVETIDTNCWRFGKQGTPGGFRWHTTALTFLVGKAWATKARPSSWEFHCWDPQV